MKRILLCVLLAASFALAGSEVPRPAMDFAVQTGPDKYIWLCNDYAGKTVVIAFILTTCPHCQFTTGILNRIQKDYSARGVQVIESAIEPMSSLHIPDFVKNFGTVFPVGYDEQTYAAKFLGYPENDPMFVPQIVFIDKQGTIRAQVTAETPGMSEPTQEDTLRATLDKVLAAEQPAPKPAAAKARPAAQPTAKQ
jgi:peroxiredoxin